MYYVTAKRNVVLEVYESLCRERSLSLSLNPSVISPDSTTLFTTSGMQHFKSQFSDESFIDTFCTIQRCLRLNDLAEVGDGTHYLDFEMIGLFSFRQWSVKESISFFMEFLSRLEIKPDYVTIHPDKISEWSSFYEDFSVEIRSDEGCLWSDGSIGGYCTEFFKDEVEIGNIVNPLGTCIDVGFGLERLLLVKNQEVNTKRLEILERCCHTIINSGVKLGHHKESSILKKLIITSILEGSPDPHPFFEEIRDNLRKNYRSYLRDRTKKHLLNKPKEYFKSSYGIDPDLLEIYERVLNY